MSKKNGSTKDLDRSEATENTLSSYIKQVETKYGPMWVNVNDQYVGRSLIEYGEFSEGEAELFRDILKPTDNVIEVGANIGALTKPIANWCNKGKILAFEPQSDCYSLLKRNVYYDTFNYAVGSKVEEIFAPTIDYGKPGNFGGVSLENIHAGTTVHQVTLDDFCGLYARLLKIDVEGMERDVIEGAVDIIKRDKPIIYCESDRVEKHAALCELLRSLGYVLYWHTPPLYNPNNWKGNKNNVFGNIASFNMFCCPLNSDYSDIIKQFGMVPVDTDASKHPLVQDVKSTEPHADNAVLAFKLQGEGKFKEAVKHYIDAIASSKDEQPVLRQHLAECYGELRDYKAAIASLKYACALIPTDALMQMQLGCYYGFIGERRQARIHAQRAVALNPRLPGAQFNLGLAQMQDGEWTDGWKNYEYRKCIGDARPRCLTPEWNGNGLNASDTLYVKVDQGIGDCIQFIRYLLHGQFKSLVNGARVVLEVQRPIAPMLFNWHGADEIVALPEDNSIATEYTEHVSLMSLPRILNQHRPYDIKNPYDISKPWHPENHYIKCHFGQVPNLPGNNKLRVGFVWKSKANNNHFDRHLEAKQFNDLCALPNVEPFALVYEADEVPEGCHRPTLNTWTDTLLWVNSMDLIIAVDGSVAHLAGAIGKPVWTILAYASDWRWGVDTSETPWYPTMKLYRQTEYRNWNPMLETLKGDLEKENTQCRK